MVTTISNEKLSVAIDSVGAELLNIRANGIEYLWQGDPAFWPRRAPVLFPVVCACPGDAYIYRGKQYAMGCHGFARFQEFTLGFSDTIHAAYELVSSPTTRVNYPFDFKLSLEYRLDGNAIITDHAVTNIGDDVMFFSLGIHPGFNTPLVPGDTKEDYDIILEREETATRRLMRETKTAYDLADEAFTGSHISIDEGTFSRRAIVLSNIQSREVTLVSRVSRHGVTMRFNDMPCLAIWSSSAAAPFVCLEPWCGLPARAGSSPALESKEGIRALAHGKTFAARTVLSVF
jgi:galactose mutarotase-like enzyme